MINRFYGGKRQTKVDKANGFVINDEKMWEGVPEEQRRRMNSVDYMSAACGKEDMFILDEVSETESEQSEDDELYEEGT